MSLNEFLNRVIFKPLSSLKQQDMVAVNPPVTIPQEEIGSKNRKIGFLDIYPQQDFAADRVMDIFLRGDGPPLLVGECQSGKSGVAISLIQKFMQYCEKSGLEECEREILYALNLSDNSLKKQNETRLRKAGLANKVTIMHHCDYSSHQPLKETKARLIVIDECHLALAASDEFEKPFHEFLKRCGIDYGKPCREWSNKNNFVLSISATPYAQEIQRELDDESFVPVYLENAEMYYSLERMDDDKRIRVVRDLLDGATVSPWFKERLVEFRQRCSRTKYGNGVMILRVASKKEEVIADYIATNHSDMDLKTFDCQKGNIDDLNDFISTPTPGLSIAIVKGSLRAGKTLGTTKYIQMMIDSSQGAKASTVVQGFVGRVLGYPCSDGHSKFEDTFPVYCNIQEIPDAIRFYEKYRNAEADSTIPSSNWNSSTVKVNSRGYTAEIIEMDGEQAKSIVASDIALRKKIGGKIAEKTPQHSSSDRSSKLMHELLQKFQSATFDERRQVFLVSSGAKPGEGVTYDILDGASQDRSLPERQRLTEYFDLFKILNHKSNERYNVGLRYMIHYQPIVEKAERIVEKPSTEHLKATCIFPAAP